MGLTLPPCRNKSRFRTVAALFRGVPPDRSLCSKRPQRSLQRTESLAMVARGRFELPSMGLFLVRESKAHHWPGHCFRPLLVHYTTGLQETRVFGQVPISLLRKTDQQFRSRV